MNALEMSTYCEPDFGLAQEIMDEFVEESMTEEEKAKRRKETEEMYRNLADDDDYWQHLGECF